MSACPDEMLRLLEPYPVVSFDVFDTLLIRQCGLPTDVHLLTDHVFSGKPLAATRVASELELRRERSAAGRDPECVSLAAIYERLAMTASLTPDQATARLCAEIESERTLCVRNQPLHQVFEGCLTRGQQVLVLSDMYLPADVIAELLRKAGYDGWSELLVSSDTGLSKAAGSVWPHVLATRGADQVVHVGDHPVSDLALPRSIGLTAVAVPRPRERAVELRALPPQPIERTLTQGLLEGLLVHDTARHGTTFATIGYRVLGPLLVGIGQWLTHEVASCGVDRVAFLARDGRILRETYARIAGPGAVRHDYVAASRRLLLLPALTTLTDEVLAPLAAGTAASTYRQCLSRFDLPNDTVDMAVGAAGVDLDAAVGADRGRLVEVLRLLGTELLARATAERELLLRYLESVGLREGWPMVVDIGWHGSLQASLEKVLQRPLAGRYFGLHGGSRARRTAGMDLSGFLEEPQETSLYSATVWQSLSLVEFLFTTEEPSVTGLVQEEDGSFTRLSDAEPAPTATRAAVMDVHREALRFVDDYVALSQGLELPVVSKAEAVAPLARLLSSPTCAEAAALGELAHVDGLGATGDAAVVARPSRSLLGYALHPRQFQQDRARSTWKAGFLRRVWATSPRPLRRFAPQGIFVSPGV